MGTISVTLPSDGETMDAADVNNPINTIVTLVNGNIDSDNVAAGGLTPANLVSGTGTSWAWQSWTPTTTNLTVGSGTLTCKYIQIGKTVHFRIYFQYGSGSSVGSAPTFTFPVAPSTSPSYIDAQPLGMGRIVDSGTAGFPCYAVYKGTTTFGVNIFGTSATYASEQPITASAPMVWAANDHLAVQGTYEAA